MRASPGCWKVYGELITGWQDRSHATAITWHHVDAYAVQHPGGAEHDRRQRQSVAVHLVSLCLLLEHAQPPEQAHEKRRRTSAVVLPRTDLSDWPYLPPPPQPGAVTAVHVHAALTPSEQDQRARAWLESAWTAWAPHHETVRDWTKTLQGNG